MTEDIKLKALQLLYALVPEIDCQSKCQEYCGPISLTELEARQIRRKYKSLPKASAETLSCNKLKAGKCSIYPLRPLVCRLWGTVPAMRCPWGCTPKDPMTNEQGKALLRQAEELSPVLETR